MKRLLIGTTLALFGLAPAIGAACEYNDASMASSPAQLGLATAPAASKAPAPIVAKASADKPVKPASDKATTQVPKGRLAEVANRN